VSHEPGKIIVATQACVKSPPHFSFIQLIRLDVERYQYSEYSMMLLQVDKIVQLVGMESVNTGVATHQLEGGAVIESRV
jgi:hypothetical protein